MNNRHCGLIIITYQVTYQVETRDLKRSHTPRYDSEWREKRGKGIVASLVIVYIKTSTELDE